jgi:Cysteine-rich CPCC
MSTTNDNQGNHWTHPCPACGYYMFSALNEQSEICLICGWQNDLVDLQEMYHPMGPNDVSLEEAQKNFKEIGAKAPKSLGHVRPPTKEDMRDPKWRPLDRAKDTRREINTNSQTPEEIYYWHWN